MNFPKLILILSLFSSFLSANSIQLSAHSEPLNITNQAKTYIDKENKNDFEYVLKNSQKLFEKNEKELVHLGYSSNAVWMKFSLCNSSGESMNKVLEISNNMLDDVFLYTKLQDGNYSEEKSGVMHERNFDEKIFNVYFNVSFKPYETKEYYLKAASLSSAVYFEANLMSKDELYQKELTHQLTLVLFFGSIVSLLIYNLFIYVFTKERAYLYYFFYLSFTVWNHLSYSGVNIYVLPQELWQTDAYFAIYYLAFLTIFAILFTREFLNLKQYKKIDLSIKAIMFSIGIILLFTLAGYYPLEEADVVFLLSFIYIVMSSLYAWVKGNKNAKFLVAGWSIALFGWIMLATQQFGYWTFVLWYLQLYF